MNLTTISLVILRITSSETCLLGADFCCSCIGVLYLQMSFILMGYLKHNKRPLLFEEGQFKKQQRPNSWRITSQAILKQISQYNRFIFFTMEINHKELHYQPFDYILPHLCYCLLFTFIINVVLIKNITGANYGLIFYPILHSIIIDCAMRKLVIFSILFLLPAASLKAEVISLKSIVSNPGRVRESLITAFSPLQTEQCPH